MSSWIALALIIIAGIFLVIVDNPGGTFGITDADLAQLVVGISLLIFLGGSMLYSYRGQGSMALKHLVVWLAIMLGLLTIYTYKDGFLSVARDVVGEVVPGKPITEPSSNGERVVAITAGQGNHFEVSALVNGTHVNFVADTGASAVILTPEDAQRAGFNIKELSYSVPVSTANGKNTAAFARIDEIRIGNIRKRNIRALITKPGMLHKSLLGMSFLGSLNSFQIKGRQLILRD
jgi:aspartyl protease family protein